MKKKYLLSLLVIILVVGLGAGAFFLVRDYLPISLQFQRDTVELETPAEIRSFYVQGFGENALIPEDDMSKGEMQDHIASIVEHAVTYGLL